MNPFILISGATGGLGSAVAAECAHRGYDLYLTDIREDVAGFADFVARKYSIQTRARVCDLTSQAERDKFLEAIRSEGAQFRGLINVAGMDYEGAFLERSRGQILQLIHLNVESALDLTHGILKLRDPETRFMLINVCSLAAVAPMPYKAVYAATKRFLLDFSYALREEIKEFGTVTALCPAGMPTTVENMTAIFAQGFWGRATTVDTRTVARITMDAAEKGKALVIPGITNQIIQFISRLLPVSMTACLVGNRWREAQQINDLWQDYLNSTSAV